MSIWIVLAALITGAIIGPSVWYLLEEISDWWPPGWRERQLKEQRDLRAQGKAWPTPPRITPDPPKEGDIHSTNVPPSGVYNDSSPGDRGGQS